MSPSPGQGPGDYSAYQGRRCLVTGGLGFIGSNLVRRLVELGADVTVVDNLSEQQGGNWFNIDEIRQSVDVRLHDIADGEIAAAVAGRDVIFNLAGKSSHLESLESPLFDMETNVRGQLVLLEAIRKASPEARVVYASTRSVYGAIRSNPVDEDHPFLPTEANSAGKAAADLYHIAYWHAHGLSTVCLRLTNIYGPRMLMKHGRQGFINWFVRLALEGKTISLYGDGSQKRDLLYVDDAVEAFLAAGLDREAAGVAFNVGSGRGASLKEIAETVVSVAGSGAISYVPFPEEAKRIEIGDYVSGTRRIEDALGWRARTALRQGLEQTCAFFEAQRKHYW